MGQSSNHDCQITNYLNINFSEPAKQAPTAAVAARSLRPPSRAGPAAEASTAAGAASPQKDCGSPRPREPGRPFPGRAASLPAPPAAPPEPTSSEAEVEVPAPASRAAPRADRGGAERHAADDPAGGAAEPRHDFLSGEHNCAASR